MNNLAKSLLQEFPGGDYFNRAKEGPYMELEERVDSPFYRIYRALFDKKKENVVRICSVWSISFPFEIRDSLFDTSLFDEVEGQLNKERLDAVIFVREVVS